MVVPSPSQDPEGQARTRARLRTMMKMRTAGGLLVLTVMAVLGVVALATGHERTGLIALVLGGLAVMSVVGQLNRRR